MASNNVVTALALESLRAPLDPYPPNNYQENFLRNMRIRFRTYYVEYNDDNGVVMLPSLFARYFGNEISRLAILVDSRNNQFEVLVDKVNGNIYLTRGWAALRDMYDLRHGGWLVLVYTGFGHFALTVYDAVQQEVNPQAFMPPMKFVIHKLDVPPHFIEDIPDSAELLGYAHEPQFFNYEYEKTLNYYDVTSGYLVVPYHDFGEFVFKQATASVKLIDDCGNVWECSLIFVSSPWKHFRLGGDWARLVAGRRLHVGTDITIGAETDEAETLYLSVDY